MLKQSGTNRSYPLVPVWLLRLLLLAELACSVVSFTLHSLFATPLLLSLEDSLAHEQAPLPHWLMLGAAGVMLLHIVAAIGLFFLKRWARVLYVSTSVLFIPFYFLPQINIALSSSALFYDLSLVCLGAVISLVYGSSLADAFVTTHTPGDTADNLKS